MFKFLKNKAGSATNALIYFDWAWMFHFFWKKRKYLL